MAGIIFIISNSYANRLRITLVASPGTLTRIRLLAPLHVEIPSVSRHWVYIDVIVVELFLGF